MTEANYIAYFEALASQHVQIQHHAELKPAFFVVREDNMDEFNNAIRTSLNYPALLLDEYLDDSDSEHDNFRLRIVGGFSVVCKVEAGDLESVRQARDEARQIARSILKRIRRDVRTPNTELSKRLVFMEPRSSGEPTPILHKKATGWGYDVTWLMPDSGKVEADDWLDLAV